MSFQEKLFELANRLFVGTAEGTIQWSETADEDSFRAVLNAGLVRIERGPVAPVDRNAIPSEYPPPPENYEYTLLVLDERNKEIGRYVADVKERRLTLRNLWELAGLSARNADEKIDFLLQEVAGRVKTKVP